MTDDGSTVDEAALRRDAEAALGELYPRVLELERMLVECRASSLEAHDAVVELQLEEERLRTRKDELEELQAQLTQELAVARRQTDAEHQARSAAEAELAALRATWPGRLAGGLALLRARLRGQPVGER